MKKKCQSCPYFSSENIELLKEILKWTRFLALNKERIAVEREAALTKELKKINRVLPLYLQTVRVDKLKENQP